MAEVGLNRTSVGLKHSSVLCGRYWPSGGPQSNQRGIETPAQSDDLIEIEAPQSNQRGIETKQHAVFLHPFPPRLNRTSVGLKPCPGSCPPDPDLASLNRTSVGLKREMWRWRMERYARLNRTSVGLKPLAAGGAPGPRPGPQSNQRGIETRPADAGRGLPGAGLNRTSVGLKPASPELRATPPPAASIEPAWD